MSNSDIRVWQINNVEWWVGAGTAAEILAAYMDETGCTHEEATGSDDDMPEPLSDEALDRLKYYDADGEDELTGEVRTFRAQLAIEVEQGGKFPRMFATTEF